MPGAPVCFGTTRNAGPNLVGKGTESCGGVRSTVRQLAAEVRVTPPHDDVAFTCRQYCIPWVVVLVSHCSLNLRGFRHLLTETQLHEQQQKGAKTITACSHDIRMHTNTACTYPGRTTVPELDTYRASIGSV